MDAASEDEIRQRLAHDPWPPEQLAIVSIEPWNVVLGGERLPVG